MSLYASLNTSAAFDAPNNALNNTTNPQTLALNASDIYIFSAKKYFAAWSKNFATPDLDPNARIGMCVNRDGLNTTISWGRFGTAVTAKTGVCTIAPLPELTETLEASFSAAETSGVAKAGDTMTGPLNIDQNVAGIKLRLAMKLPGTQQDAPTTLGVTATYLGLGGGEWNASSYRLIGFGYIGAAGNEYPGVIGYQETSTSSNTRGDLIFGTRPNNNNVAPTIVMRINSAGQILAEAGASYVPGSDGALVNRKYVADNTVTKTTTANIMYGTDGAGAAMNYPVAQGTTSANTVPLRGATGAILTGTPTVANHAATMGYVDTATAPKSGTTAQRPASPAVGTMYFDTTLGKPIWFKSPGWVDATGAAAA